MWLSNNVEIDDLLLSSHQEGKLVFFVGAGASMGPPSDLPDFKKLTQEICELHGTSLSKLGYGSGVKEPYVFPFDLVLDQFGSPYSVKKAAVDIIGRASSEHTELHEQIMRLSCSGPKPKIVTTNFDSHLTFAAESMGFVGLEVFHAPAVPLGRDFEGIVHVHGSLERDQEHLVLTRTDFGKAYLTDGWATNFLYEMFANFTVLFIGYSHRDLIVDYLARGLEKRNGLRFALTEDTNPARWKELGIIPIHYDLDAASGHSFLLDAIRNWADLVALGASEMRNRIRSIVENPPSLNKADNSLVEWAIANPVAVDFVAQFAGGIDWLSWMIERDSIKEIFSPGMRVEDSNVLVDWIVEKCVLEPTVSGKVLEIIMNKNGVVGEALWRAIAQGLSRPAGMALAFRDRWITWLISAAPRNSRRSLSNLIVGRTFQVGPETSLELWSHLTKPILVLKPTFSIEESDLQQTVYASLDFPGDEHALDNFWRGATQTLSDQNVWSILQIAESNLGEAQRLDRSFKSVSTSTWDIFAIRRPAIAEHDQNSARDAADILIDSARDSLCFAFSVDPDRAMIILESWLKSGVQIIRRIAWHCLGACSGASPVAIVTKVLSYQVLKDSLVKPEVYYLLRKVLPEVNEDLIRTLVQEISNIAELESYSAHSKLDLLKWILDAAPESESIRHAFNAMTELHPDFVASEHPELNSWVSSGFVVNTPIWSVEEFVLRTKRDAAESLDELLKNFTRTSPFEAPRWEDSLATIYEGVRSNPAAGFILWAEVVSRGSVSGLSEVAQAIIQGWNSGELSAAEYWRVIQLGLRVVELSDLAHSLSIFLVKASKIWEKELEPVDTQVAEELAQRVLAVHLDKSIPSSSLSQAYAEAINDSCGNIAEFYLYLVSAQRKRAGDNWLGIPEVLANSMESMIFNSSDHSTLVLSVFSAQLNFLQSLDATWTSTFLLPILKWEGEVRLSLSAWSGFLTAARWNEGLLSPSMLDSYFHVIADTEHFTEGQRERACQHLAGIALFSVSFPGNKPWVRKFMFEAPSPMKVEFINIIARSLESIDSEVIDRLWDSWLHDFWNLSLIIDTQESNGNLFTALAGWIPFLRGYISEIVPLIGDSHARLDAQSSICSRLISSGIALDYPEEIAQILLSLLKRTPHGEINYDLKECVEVLRPLISAGMFRSLVNASLNVGYRDATMW
jgi:hypothetical protein